MLQKDVFSRLNCQFVGRGGGVHVKVKTQSDALDHCNLLHLTGDRGCSLAMAFQWPTGDLFWRIWSKISGKISGSLGCISEVAIHRPHMLVEVGSMEFIDMTSWIQQVNHGLLWHSCCC